MASFNCRRGKLIVELKRAMDLGASRFLGNCAVVWFFTIFRHIFFSETGFCSSELVEFSCVVLSRFEMSDMSFGLCRREDKDPCSYAFRSS
jgi:hypothetical protein